MSAKSTVRCSANWAIAGWRKSKVHELWNGERLWDLNPQSLDKKQPLVFPLSWSTGKYLAFQKKSLKGLNPGPSVTTTEQNRLRLQGGQRWDSNPCGQSPMDFESISLAARTHCHVHVPMQKEYFSSSKGSEPQHLARQYDPEMPTLGFKPRLSRPQRDVLTTRRCRQMMKLYFMNSW